MIFFNQEKTFFGGNIISMFIFIYTILYNVYTIQLKKPIQILSKIKKPDSGKIR